MGFNVDKRSEARARKGPKDCIRSDLNERGRGREGLCKGEVEDSLVRTSEGRGSLYKHVGDDRNEDEEGEEGMNERMNERKMERKKERQEEEEEEEEEEKEEEEEEDEDKEEDEQEDDEEEK
ncbi:hypothetical protein E2C01_000134 [Portunus trituberculatus]|uniref:Uncharacterized protein n=1 Tax=Portunus trituberculatus TaxID=210409 RepID=A0A5B7CEC9_PORTR|nr:hypothetical protein [Portunus trituberculatus]